MKNEVGCGVLREIDFLQALNQGGGYLPPRKFQNIA